MSAPEIEHAWLLPLLEGPYAGAKERLPELMQARGWSGGGTEEVSFERIVLLGLTFGSAHWFASAVKWLEQGFPVNAEIARAVHERRADPSLPQGARQSAFALVRRWEKVKGAAAS